MNEKSAKDLEREVHKLKLKAQASSQNKSKLKGAEIFKAELVNLQ